MGLPLPPAWHGGRGPSPTQPTSSSPAHSGPASARLEQRWGPCWGPGGSPRPMPPPAPCHRLGPGQSSPVTGGSSPGPGHDLRGDLERVPAGAGHWLCLSSPAGTFPCPPQGRSQQQLNRHHNQPETPKIIPFSLPLSAARQRALLCRVPSAALCAETSSRLRGRRQRSWVPAHSPGHAGLGAAARVSARAGASGARRAGSLPASSPGSGEAEPCSNAGRSPGRAGLLQVPSRSWVSWWLRLGSVFPFSFFLFFFSFLSDWYFIWLHTVYRAVQCNPSLAASEIRMGSPEIR